jgi:hypothetical protein
MVRGREAMGLMWKSTAEQVSDPKLTTIDVKPLGPSAAREIGMYSLKTKGPDPKEVTGKYVVVGKRSEMTGGSRQISGMTASRLGTRVE